MEKSEAHLLDGAEDTYWEGFFKLNKSIDRPSQFCDYVLKNYDFSDKRILEICSGNGRDSYFLSHFCKKIVAVDKALKPSDGKNLTFVKSEIGSFLQSTEETFDLTYCRFGLHSVNRSLQTEILNFSKNVFFEFRSDKDSSYKKDHYRRKINGNEFLKCLIKHNYEILYFKESKGLAILGDQDPMIIRVIAKKKTRENNG